MSVQTSEAEQDSLIGRTVCGCEILRLIGCGGMGSLYQARQVSLDRTVALKVLAPALSSNQEFLGRFRREARSLATLLHPNIVAVHDFGEEEDACGIVMEYVEGESVADMLTRTAIIPIPTALAIVRQVAEGLAFAHSREIIHCDLKPENILVTPNGVAKVVDFGLAKSVRGDAMRVTTDGAILGTPTYMSPEQCEGKELDARTDIYSLGASFYRMVAGRDAFEGENPFAVMLKHKTEPPRDPREFNREMPGPVAHLILRMMAKPRDERIQAASEVAEAIARLQGEDASEAQAAADPRREGAFVRQAIEAGLVTLAQVRQCLALHDNLRRVNVEESFASLMVRRGMLTEQQVEHILSRAEAMEAIRRDREFGRLAVEARLVTSAQLARCLQRQQRLRATGPTVKLSKVMVDDGVIQQEQVVQLLLRQLKDAQQREDEEFVELVRSKAVLTDDEIRRCVEEQKLQEAQGHPKVLRQIVAELGLLPVSQVRALLRAKVRADIESYLRERERSQSIPDEAVIPDEVELKLSDTEPCPACSQVIEVGIKCCPHCGSEVEKARAEAARLGVESLHRAPKAKPAAEPQPEAQAAPARTPTNLAIQWEIRLPSGEPSQPLSFGTLVKLGREKRLKARTVLRGPLTRGIWRQARHTPRLCRLFGTCHYCEAELEPHAAECTYCGAHPDRPKDD